VIATGFVMEPGFIDTPQGAAIFETFVNDHILPDDVPGQVTRAVIHFYEVCDACKTSDKPWKCGDRHVQSTAK
jgi:hypothetical protein